VTGSKSTGQAAQGKSPLYHSHRFWIQVMAAWVFTMLTMFGTVEITGNQLLTFVLALAGLGVGARTVTGVTGILANNAVERQQVQAQARAQCQTPSCPPCLEPTMMDLPQADAATKGKGADGTQPAMRFGDPPFPPLREDGEPRATRRKVPPPPVGHKGGC
jgi:hypothetical protein